jgi:2-polyprenyl-3-methyl-5-hydroxy-6-metoxy-1,4-benzoquinol methylase
VALLERHTSIQPGAKWLDIGCQIGQFIKFLRARHRIDATGVDNFEATNVREVCRKYFHVDIKEPREVLDDSWRYHFRWVDKGFNLDERFSFISALEVLEHMLDTDAFLEECRNHLQDGGHLVISTPNLNSLRNRVGFPFGAYPNGLEYRMIIHHVRLYNAPILKSHVEEHGFRLVAMAGVNFVPAKFLTSRIVRAIDARLADRFPNLCGNLIAIFKMTSKRGRATEK